jgi:hypothetical protein
MEILEKQDPEKKRLMDEAKMHKDNLTHEVKALSEQTEKVILNAVMIGGALVATYFLVRQLSGSRSKKKKKKAVTFVAQAPKESAPTEDVDYEVAGDSILNQIGAKIASEATVFLLNLAKEKLSEYLQSGKEKPNENH